MSFPAIVDQIRESAQSSPRPAGAVCRFIWHHQASTNDDATIRMMVDETRQVSATFTVDNKPPASAPGRLWARITGVIRPSRRPWTSSSAAADGLAFTAEVANVTGAPGYGIAEASVEAAARLALWAYLEHGVPLKRATKDDPTGHLGHDEVLGMFGQGYVTACPLHLPIDRIIARARELLGSSLAGAGRVEILSPWEQYERETDMNSLLVANDPAAKPATRWAVTGPGYWRVITTKAGADAASQRYGVEQPSTWGEWDAAFAAAVGSGFVPAPGQTARTVP